MAIKSAVPVLLLCLGVAGFAPAEDEKKKAEKPKDTKTVEVKTEDTSVSVSKDGTVKVEAGGVSVGVDAATAAAAITLTFASGDVEVAAGPEDVLLALKRAREKAGHKDAPEALRRLPLAITVSTGGGAVGIDLTGLSVVSLTVTTKDGSAEVTLPGEGDIRGTLQSGEGAITLYTPPSRSVNFNIVRKGAGYIGVEEGVRRRGGAPSEFDASSGGAAIVAEPLKAR